MIDGIASPNLNRFKRHKAVTEIKTSMHPCQTKQKNSEQVRVGEYRTVEASQPAGWLAGRQALAG